LTGGRREKDQRVSIHEENFSGREGTRNGKRIRRDMEESEERLRAETEDHQIRAIDGFDCRTTDATSTHTRVVNCIERERERERERAMVWTVRSERTDGRGGGETEDMSERVRTKEGTEGKQAFLNSRVQPRSLSLFQCFHDRAFE